MDISYEKYRSKVLKSDCVRKTRVKSPHGVREAYRWYLKHWGRKLPKDISESTYHNIIRRINLALFDEVLKGDVIVFPCRMGSISLIRYDRKNRSYEKSYVDWESTIRLWYEDEEARESKFLVKHTDKKLIYLRYDRTRATFKNKIYYQYEPHRALKRAITRKVREDPFFDAFIK